MSESKSDATYTMGRTEEEEDRLIQQSQLYDAVTRRFFREAGISSGMKVLDNWQRPWGCGSDSRRVGRARRGRRGRGCKSGDSRNGAGTGAGGRVHQRRIRRGGRPDFRHRKRLRRHNRPASPHVHGRSSLSDAPETTSDPACVQEGSWLFRRLISPPISRCLILQIRPSQTSLIGWILEVFERSGAHIDMGFGLYPRFRRGGPARAVHALRVSSRRAGWLGWIPIRGQQLAQRAPAPRTVTESPTAEELDVDTLAERVRQEVVTSKRPIRLAPHVTAWAQLAS